jgi:RimJ/RimL family protein N-acetyltransferase
LAIGKMMTPRLPTYIETERLVLRHWTEEDLPAMAAAITASLEHLRPWMPWVAHEPLSVKDRLALIRRWRQEWEDGGDTVVGLFADHVVVGGSGLHRRVGETALEIGYWIHVDHTGKGLATETAAALTTAAFAVPGIERIEIHHDQANLASAGVPRRLGFTLVGEAPRDAEAPAEIGIECRWVMTRQTWVERAG